MAREKGKAPAPFLPLHLGVRRMFQTILDDLKQTWKQPFRADMSSVDWFLFVGVLLIVMILWRIILRHITEG